MSSGTAKLLQTGSLDVCFQKPISLSDTRPQAPPLVEKLICGDGVFVENRTIENGLQISYDRMEAEESRSEQHHRRFPRRRAGLADQRPPRRRPELCHARRPARRPRPPGGSSPRRIRPAATRAARSQSVDMHPPEIHEVAYRQQDSQRPGLPRAGPHGLCPHAIVDNHPGKRRPETSRPAGRRAALRTHGRERHEPRLGQQESATWN